MFLFFYFLRLYWHLNLTVLKWRKKIYFSLILRWTNVSCIFHENCAFFYNCRSWLMCLQSTKKYRKKNYIFISFARRLLHSTFSCTISLVRFHNFITMSYIICIYFSEGIKFVIYPQGFSFKSLGYVSFLFFFNNFLENDLSLSVDRIFIKQFYFYFNTPLRYNSFPYLTLLLLFRVNFIGKCDVKTNETIKNKFSVMLSQVFFMVMLCTNNI